MQKMMINNAKNRINENILIIDTGVFPHVDIDIEPGCDVKYLFVPSTQHVYYRQIRIGAQAKFQGMGIILAPKTKATIITEVVGDEVSSNLSLLTLGLSKEMIDVEGVAKVERSYKDVSVRVDQTNILIGEDVSIRALPRLMIATNDIVGGHSCRIHRLGGESLFYLESRGIKIEHAEAMLLNSEILKHLQVCDDENDRHNYCYQIHKEITAIKNETPTSLIT